FSNCERAPAATDRIVGRALRLRWQAKRLPYSHSSGNLLPYDYTTCHPRTHWAASCTRCAALCPGPSKSATAVPIATTATVSKRRSSSCDDASKHVRSFYWASEIHQRLRSEIPRQQISYAISA